MAAKFGEFVDEDHDKPPTLYWLPKLSKKTVLTKHTKAKTTTLRLD